MNTVSSTMKNSIALALVGLCLFASCASPPNPSTIRYPEPPQPEADQSPPPLPRPVHLPENEIPGHGLEKVN
jgi:hypothetical protein